MNMALNLIQNFSFEDGTNPWQTAGPAGSEAPVTGAFEGTRVGTLGPFVGVTPGNAVLSQAFPVSADAVNVRLSYAIQRSSVPPVVNEGIRVEIVWQRGAADNYSEISRETLEELVGLDVAVPTNWETHVIVSGPKPAEALQARLRFIAFNPLVGVLSASIDEVVVTAES